jgi:hypothetical protein
LNLSHTISTDKKENALICCNDEDYHWMKLAFDTLKIVYAEEEVEVDEDQFHYFFEFKINDIKTKSVELYDLLIELNSMSDTLSDEYMDLYNNENYIETNNKLYTFEECEKFDYAVSNDNLGTLASHICIKELAEHVDGFVEKDGILYLDINGEFLAIQRKK